MSSDRLKELIDGKLKLRLERLNIPASGLKKGTDLVRSGLVNSMEFVEMVAELENELGVELDYEKELDKEGFTTYQGLTDTFRRYIDGRS